METPNFGNYSTIFAVASHWSYYSRKFARYPPPSLYSPELHNFGSEHFCTALLPCNRRKPQQPYQLCFIVQTIWLFHMLGAFDFLQITRANSLKQSVSHLVQLFLSSKTCNFLVVIESVRAFALYPNRCLYIISISFFIWDFISYMPYKLKDLSSVLFQTHIWKKYCGSTCIVLEQFCIVLPFRFFFSAPCKIGFLFKSFLTLLFFRYETHLIA